MQKNLIKKYNVPGPRYTSYPTVPYWEHPELELEDWLESVKRSFSETNHRDGISLYIHLPYCESLCTFCACNKRITVNHAVEEPYINAVLDEWKMYVDIFPSVPRIKEIHLGGGTPTFFSPQNLDKLINGILSISEKCEGAEFSFEGHPKNTTEDHLQTLFKIGFNRVSVGVQDFDPVVQDVINRIQPYEMVEAVTVAARKIGYDSLNFDLVYGLPLQTKTSIEDTFEKVMRLRPDRIAYYSYAHVPWHGAGQRKFSEDDLPADDEKRELYELGRDKLEEAGYHEIGMDHFALEDDTLYTASKAKKLHRNFMGYTANHTQLMIGLGVSSIGDTLYAFGQNVKTVEGYMEKVEQGNFPIFRGHILSDDDLIVRKHITNIMCHNETTWDSVSDRESVIQDGVFRLKELELDGLVVVKEDGLMVPDIGKPFIRNICMALDARLWANVPETEVFSKTI
ncbi:MAG TPA: oxygen-independent coproporphyrinogen III oxidase [Flavobacteriales bacterium]|nr:oxygen-independent coproporphyrinogen III oxidase [Flavobacteriales bacterium]